MKKIILTISLLFLLSCTEQTQTQKQSQITNNSIVEQSNFNTVPWASIDSVEGIGEVRINKMKKEFENGQFKSGKDFEKRMEGKLSKETIGKIGLKFKFEVVE